MGISVEFQSPPGTILATRQFNPGDSIRIAGKVTTSLGLPNSFQPVRLEVVDSFTPLFVESRTNVAGNYWFDVILPDVVSAANVIVTAWFPVGSPEQVVVPIGIGTTPPELPAPQPSFLDSLMPLIMLGVMVMLVGKVGTMFGGKK